MTLNLFLFFSSFTNIFILLSFFIFIEIIYALILLIEIKKQNIKLETKYIILDSTFFIFFILFLILAHEKKFKYFSACFFMFIRLGIRLKTYCTCNEDNEENDLEIFFKVNYFNNIVNKNN